MSKDKISREFVKEVAMDLINNYKKNKENGDEIDNLIANASIGTLRILLYQLGIESDV